MAKEPYRAGIIGLGMIGGADPVSADALGQSVEQMDGTHFRSLTDHPRVEVVAGSTRDPGRRERFARRSGAKVYADFRELLERENLDIVSVASYAPVHAEHVIAAAEAGARAILCEKPIATSLADADRMVRTCKEREALLVVNHQRRFNLNHRRLRDRIQDGELGDLTSGFLQWGSGRLGNVGTHAIDAIRMLTCREAEAVSGHLDPAGKPDCRGDAFRDPGGWGMLRMEGGLMVLVDAADYATVPLHLALNGTAGRAWVGVDGIHLQRNRGEDEYWPSVSDPFSSMHRAVDEIVSWLDHGSSFPAPGDDAVHTLEAIIGFHVSHGRNAAWVDLPLSGADRMLEVRSG